ncbi:hypothetical protein NL676_007089 [Syzygium grande]|nr:hypothetical protein NL676_007089 [Syzygium grande]
MKFIAENIGRHDFDAEEFFNFAKWRIYRCLTHLKHVEIVDPSADLLTWETVLSLLKFLLQNAPSLDEIVVNNANSKSSKAIDPWGLLEVARIILSHPKCYPCAKVTLKYLPKDVLNVCVYPKLFITADDGFSSILYPGTLA